jgi:hypothetical protein
MHYILLKLVVEGCLIRDAKCTYLYEYSWTSRWVRSLSVLMTNAINNFTYWCCGFVRKGNSLTFFRVSRYNQISYFWSEFSVRCVLCILLRCYVWFREAETRHLCSANIKEVWARSCMCVCVCVCYTIIVTFCTELKSNKISRINYPVLFRILW